MSEIEKIAREQEALINQLRARVAALESFAKLVAEFHPDGNPLNLITKAKSLLQ